MILYTSSTDPLLILCNLFDDPLCESSTKPPHILLIRYTFSRNWTYGSLTFGLEASFSILKIAQWIGFGVSRLQNIGHTCHGFRSGGPTPKHSCTQKIRDRRQRMSLPMTEHTSLDTSMCTLCSGSWSLLNSWFVSFAFVSAPRFWFMALSSASCLLFFGFSVQVTHIDTCP